MSHSVDDAIDNLSERQQAAMPLVISVLGAACAEYDVDSVQAVVALIARHPRLLTELIGWTTDSLAGKEDELQRRVRHPGPSVVKDPKDGEVGHD